MDFQYSKESGLSLNQALDLEWLETNGIGGYASSSLVNCNTRKYHGMLIASLPEKDTRFVLLSKLDEWVVAEKDGQMVEHNLSTHQYANALLDNGYNNLLECLVAANPRFIYAFDDVVISKEVLMPYGEDTVLVKYKLQRNGKKAALKLRLRPLFAYRDFHALTVQNDKLNSAVEVVDDVCMLTPYAGMPAGFMTVNKGKFSAEKLWYKGFCYQREIERGFASCEDLFALGDFDVDLNFENEIIFCFSLHSPHKNLAAVWDDEIARRSAETKALTGTPLQQQLKKIGLSFLIEDKDTSYLQVIAGYHWFGTWGRDTMISLPGLCLYSGLEREFVLGLQAFCYYEKDGLLPNVLNIDADKHVYNSVDTSLWFVWALQQYYLKSRDLGTIEAHFWPVLQSIFRNYRDGTDYGIKMGDNFLLYAGEQNSEDNLTWMDTKVDGVCVTPRSGAAVEVNALWYNALCFMRVLALQFRDPIESELAFLIPKVRKEFRDKFWNESLGYLLDFIPYADEDEKRSRALRPNQIFAVSLPYSPITQKMAVQIVEIVANKLLTPFGLRTLSVDDECYIGTYTGDAKSRDYAYHNGTVWPWLLAAFAEAASKIYDKEKVGEMLLPCVEALSEQLKISGGVGTLAEIFNGDAPHAACGCISQAWSVAEFLRLTYML